MPSRSNQSSSWSGRRRRLGGPSAQLIFLALALLMACSPQASVTAASDDGGKCSSESSSYLCPNCGGILVSDCLDCDGYLSTDTSHDICVDRRLFQRHNDDETDHDDHYHYLWNDLVGMVVWFVAAGVATACGVGGGGIYVPLGILLFQFAPKQASGLSQASIFGASLGGIFLNIRNQHPESKIRDDPGEPQYRDKKNNNKGKQDNSDDDDDDKTNSAPAPAPRRHLQLENAQREQAYVESGGTFYTRPLINYDMALFLSPMEMAGAVLGVLVQKILPNWLYLLIAGMVLCFTSYKTYKKFFAAREKEKQAEAKTKAADATAAAADASSAGKKAITSATSTAKSPQTEETFHTASGENSGDEENHKDDNKVDDDDHQEEQAMNMENGTKTVVQQLEDSPEALQLRREYLRDDMRQYPAEKLVTLVILWIGLFLLTLFKGGKGVESLVGIDCESPWYGVLIALQFLWMFGFALYYARKLLKQQQARVAVSYPYQPDDPIWDAESLRFYGLFTFIAGIVAGLIGIGGGMVLGPLMLVMGIHPRVSSATTATMIVLTSSSVAVIFVTSGLVPWSYAVFYFGVCFCGAYIGKSQIDAYVKRTGRASLLIFILATIIAFATVGCLVIMLTRLNEKDWCFDGFNKFCNIDSEEECPADRLLQGLLDTIQPQQAALSSVLLSSRG